MVLALRGNSFRREQYALRHKIPQSINRALQGKIFGGTYAAVMDASEFKSIRKDQGWSQMDLAELMGTSQTVISNIETGRVEVDRRTELALRALVSGIGVEFKEDPFTLALREASKRPG